MDVLLNSSDFKRFKALDLSKSSKSLRLLHPSGPMTRTGWPQRSLTQCNLLGPSSNWGSPSEKLLTKISRRGLKCLERHMLTATQSRGRSIISFTSLGNGHGFRLKLPPGVRLIQLGLPRF